ncbi:hypothetical protein FRC01_001233 [Tulasnella sp. 417]|nr:hypothetical protein FRC01_001233 [Tulasnella sp. 417]
MFDPANFSRQLAICQAKYSTELVIWRQRLRKEEFETILRSPSLRRLTLRSVDAERDFAQRPTHPNLINSTSSIQTLDLNYPPQTPINIPQSIALLVLVPSLKTLLTTPRSFKGIGELLAIGTFTMPQIRHLRISNDSASSLNKSHLLSFLHRCATLETLQISRPIMSRALAQEELPAKMPNLTTYEGRPEYLTYFHAPSLRRAVVKYFSWDGGALINALASMSTNLESVVIELTSKSNDPVMRDIEASSQWVEVAAGRWNAHQEEAPKFSLVLRASPLGEWIYSARMGRNDVDELFIEYFSRREQATSYLLNKVAVGAAE